MPSAVLAELPDLGHLAHEESPETVAALIRPFLAQHLGATGPQAGASASEWSRM
jgi:hypothetical protein